MSVFGSKPSPVISATVPTGPSFGFKVKIVSGGDVNVNALVDSRAGSGGNLIVGSDVTLGVAPQLGAGNIFISGSVVGDFNVSLRANEISQLVPRPDIQRVPAERLPSIADRFQAADRNNDALLTPDEFLAFLPRYNRAAAWRLFQAIDLDADGLVSLDELETYLRRRRGRLTSASAPPALQVAAGDWH